MKNQHNRRRILKSIGVASTLPLVSASTVSAKSENSADYALPDLRARTFRIKSDMEISVEITNQETGERAAKRDIVLGSVENDRHPPPKDFNFRLPRGEYRVSVSETGESLASVDINAPRHGYPTNRGVVIEADDTTVSIYEHYI